MKKELKATRQNFLMVILIVLTLSGCASQPKNQIMLMPAPDVFDQGDWDPFTDRGPVKDIPYGGILYATDRKPAREERQYYLDDRGHVLRLGVAKVTVGKEDMTWGEARRISLLKKRPEDYPLKVSDIQQIGILDRSINVLTDSLVDKHQRQLPGEQFAAKVNAKLAVSRVKDVFIYVHGYKVVFENPLLVASELWHFLGYEGAFIAFVWPSPPSTLAYFSDLETAALSAGSLRIGHVILAGSDIDLHLFGSYLVDGMLDVADNVTVCASAEDKALDMSKWVFGRQRLGQSVSFDLSEAAVNYLWQNSILVIVNATDAPGADTGNGHAYFRKSPWTSSDILVTLTFDLKPEERGLEQTGGRPIWTFSADYIDKLRAALVKAQSN